MEKIPVDRVTESRSLIIKHVWGLSNQQVFHWMMDFSTSPILHLPTNSCCSCRKSLHEQFHAGKAEDFILVVFGGSISPPCVNTWLVLFWAGICVTIRDSGWFSGWPLDRKSFFPLQTRRPHANALWCCVLACPVYIKPLNMRACVSDRL